MQMNEYRTDLFEVFPWNKNFETGHLTIDEQHKKLVNMLNILARTLVNEDPVEVNEAIEELRKYAELHFSEEEEIWSEVLDGEDYWLTSHQISHSTFLPKVLDFKTKKKEQSLTDAVEGIVKFLIRWLAFHIIDNDKRLAFVVDGTNKGMDIHAAKSYADKKMGGSMRVLIETILNMYDRLSTSAIAMLREKSARIRAEDALQEAKTELKILEGILPICAHCKKIRNQSGHWDRLEDFFVGHTSATFSHTICPCCAEEHYPEFKLNCS